jgi:hypothetical protein
VAISVVSVAAIGRSGDSAEKKAKRLAQTLASNEAETTIGNHSVAKQMLGITPSQPEGMNSLEQLPVKDVGLPPDSIGQIQDFGAVLHSVGETRR